MDIVFPDMPSFDEVSNAHSEHDCVDEFTFEWPDVSSDMAAIEGDDDDSLLSLALSLPPLNHKHNGVKQSACVGHSKVAKKGVKKVAKIAKKVAKIVAKGVKKV